MTSETTTETVQVVHHYSTRSCVINFEEGHTVETEFGKAQVKGEFLCVEPEEDRRWGVVLEDDGPSLVWDYVGDEELYNLDKINSIETAVKDELVAVFECDMVTRTTESWFGIITDEESWLDIERQGDIDVDIYEREVWEEMQNERD